MIKESLPLSSGDFLLGFSPLASLGCNTQPVRQRGFFVRVFSLSLFGVKYLARETTGFSVRAFSLRSSKASGTKPVLMDPIAGQSTTGAYYYYWFYHSGSSYFSYHRPSSTRLGLIGPFVGCLLIIIIIFFIEEYARLLATKPARDGEGL